MMNISAELTTVLIIGFVALFFIYIFVKGEWNERKSSNAADIDPPYRNGEIILHKGKRHVIVGSYKCNTDKLKHTIHLCAPIDNTEGVDYIPMIPLIENACHEWSSEVNKINLL